MYLHVTEETLVSVLSSFCAAAIVAAKLCISYQDTCQIIGTCKHNQNNFVLNIQAEESCDK